MTQISANELRLGNLVHYKQNDGNIIEHATIWEDIMIICGNPGGYNRHHTPIPITPEWLERFGFECVYKSAMHSTYFNKCMSYYFWNKPWNKPNQQYAEFKGEIIHCDFVHQLQNLVHALTGTELILKP